MTSLMISDEKVVSVVVPPLKFHVEVADFIRPKKTFGDNGADFRRSRAETNYEFVWIS